MAPTWLRKQMATWETRCMQDACANKPPSCLVLPWSLRPHCDLRACSLAASSQRRAYVQAMDIDSSATSPAATQHPGRRHNTIPWRFLACAHPWMAITPEASAVAGNSSTLSAIRSKPATQARTTFCSITHRPANKCCCVYSAEHAHTRVRLYATSTELYEAGAYRRTTSR